MKKLFLIVASMAILVSFNFDNSMAQELSDPVYWMVTAEVSIGKLPDYYVFSENEMMPLMVKHGYHFIAGWQTIVGNIEEVISVAEFASMSTYHKARKSLLGSEEWKLISKKYDVLTRGTESKLLSDLPYMKKSTVKTVR